MRNKKEDKQKKRHYTRMAVLQSYRLGKGRGKKKKNVLQHAVLVFGHPTKY